VAGRQSSPPPPLLVCEHREACIGYNGDVSERLQTSLADAYRIERELGGGEELYEAKGDRAKAREYHVKLLDPWKRADPELQPIGKDTRERVARLSGEH
jgi:hypothetical protein